MRQMILVAALAGFVAGPAYAGSPVPMGQAPVETPVPAGQTPVPPPSMPAPSEARVAAAMELLKANNSTLSMTAMVDNLMLIEAHEIKRAHPDLDQAKFDSVQKILRDEFVSREDEYQHLIAVVYAQHFDEAELHTLTAFYQSDIGRKYVDSLPGMLKELSPVGEVWAQDVVRDALKKVMEKMPKPDGEHA